MKKYNSRKLVPVKLSLLNNGNNNLSSKDIFSSSNNKINHSNNNKLYQKPNYSSKLPINFNLFMKNNFSNKSNSRGSNKLLKRNKSSPKLINTLENITLEKKNKLYNISLLTKQKQLTFSKNRILLINLTSSITELAKILVLSGFNICLHDKEKITLSDINNNIFLKPEDLGKPRMETIYSCLMPLSATVNISMTSDYSLMKDYKIVIVGFDTFYNMVELEEYFNRRNKLFFCLNTSGLYGFFYHNVTDKNFDIFKEVKENGNNNSKNRINTLPINFLKKSEKFFENADKKIENDYLIYAIYSLEYYFRKNVDKKVMKNVIKNEVYGENNFVKKMYYIENFFISKKFRELLKNEELMNIIKKFIINFNKEFNPICSVMAKQLFYTLFELFLNGVYPKKSFVTYNSDTTEYDKETFLH